MWYTLFWRYERHFYVNFDCLICKCGRDINFEMTVVVTCCDELHCFHFEFLPLILKLLGNSIVFLSRKLQGRFGGDHPVRLRLPPLLGKEGNLRLF